MQKEKKDLRDRTKSSALRIVDAGIVSAEKLAPLREECDELTAIFVTILKRAKTS